MKSLDQHLDTHVSAQFVMTGCRALTVGLSRIASAAPSSSKPRWSQSDVIRCGRFLATPYAEVSCMRYIVAWALGVPFSIVVLWYIVAHAGC